MAYGNSAYWISPEGVVNNLGRTHIAFLSDNAELFNTTREEIHAVYKKYNEPIGLEGKARAEIMTEAMKCGWIRIREKRNCGFTIELWELESSANDFLLDWCRDKPIYDPVKINLLKFEQAGRPQDQWFISTSIKDLLAGSLQKYLEDKLRND